MPSGGWLFANFTENGYWGGFTASNRTDLNQSGLDAQYTAAAGCGYDGSTQYAVAYTMGMQTDVYATDGQSHTVTGCYVTNDLWTYQDILQGGYGEPPYGGTTGNDPDWFKVTATGKNASGQVVGTLDFYLADYRFSNNAEDYVLNTWEWFDLSPLGNVATISFSLSSSRGSGYNMITPAYFCMDNFNGGGAAPDLPPYIVNPVQDVIFNEYPQTIQVNLDGVATDPDDPDENITYSIVSNSNPSALSATMDNKILVMTRQNANQATSNLTMRATSDGQSVDFMVHVIINSLAQPLCGTYVIDADATQNPDFTSFNEAVEALSAGVSCEVIFEVAPGTYEEYVTINSITGASDTHRVIFRGMGADNQQVVLTSNAGYTNNSTLTLDGPDHVTFENMTLSSTSENTAIVVTLRGGLTSDRFENVRFVGCYSDASNTDNNKNLVYRVSGGWMDTNNAFVDCEFVNGFIGLYYQGVDLTQYNDGLLVENCIFTNQCSKSIYATFTDHVTLRGNMINNSNDTHTDYNAIDMFRCRYGCVVENNVMNVNHPTKYVTVVKLRPCTGTAAEPIIVRNNIVDFQGASSSWCYSFDNADSEHIYFAHNTGKCSGSGGSGNLFVQKDWEHFFAYNNLLVNETSGYVFRFNVASDNRFCDYNRVSFMGSNIGIYAGTDCATLADWTATSGFDSQTALCTPQFVGNNDLHITNSEGLIVANPLSYVTTDIDGENRTSTPCAGADEYVTISDLPPYIANPVQDVIFNEYPQTIQVNLDGVATDPDDPDENITYSIVNNTNTSALTVTLNGQVLTMTRQNADQATADLTMRATSDGQTVDFNVHVIINAVIDEPPYIANPVQDVIFNEYPQTIQVNLDGVATDPDDPDENITYSIVNNTNTSALTVTLNGQVLTMTRQNADQATADLTMRATSDGQTVDFNVHVIINAVIDEPPYIANPVQDVIFNEYPQTIQVNLDGVATDPDDPDENITYSIVNNTNTSALTVTLNGQVLTMTRQNADQATADLTMRATSDGQTVDFNIHVIINAIVDQPPYIINLVSEVVMNEFPKIIYIDLNGVATDPDDPDELIEFELLSNSNEDALLAVLNGRELRLERLTEDQAEADVSLRATSDGQYVDFVIHVIMNHVESVGENTASFEAYPNPTSGMITVAVSKDMSYNYVVYDMLGQEVMSGNAIGHETHLDLGACPSSVYFVSVFWNGSRMTQKVVVR